MSASRASFPLDHDGADSATSAQVDFARVPESEVTELLQALQAAGAGRLLGPLRGSGFLPGFERETHVTFFVPNRGVRARALVALSFSFGPDVLDPRARRIEELLDAFARDLFPELFPEAVRTGLGLVPIQLRPLGD